MIRIWAVSLNRNELTLHLTCDDRQEGSLQLQAMGFDGSEAKKALEAHSGGPRPISFSEHFYRCHMFRKSMFINVHQCSASRSPFGSLKSHASLKPGHFWQCRCSGSFALWLSLKAVWIFWWFASVFFSIFSDQNPQFLPSGMICLHHSDFSKILNFCSGDFQTPPDTFCAGTALCRMSQENERWGRLRLLNAVEVLDCTRPIRSNGGEVCRE